jgi:hypothetical protein
MKIRTVKTISDGVFKVAVSCEGFSERDTELMSEFGQPEIDVGGFFSLDGTPAEQTGAVDVSLGGDWTADSRTLALACKGASTTVTLDSAYADAAAIAAAVSAQIPEVSPASLGMEVTAAGGRIRVVSKGKGDIYFITVNATPNSANAQLGLTVGSSWGDGPSDFVLRSDLRRVQTDSPFLRSFDSRDMGLPEAEASADGWAREVVARVKFAMAILRGNHDTYSGESLETY